MTDLNLKPKIIMRQRWSDLLFLHWSIDPDFLQTMLPDGLVVDVFNGSAYVGIVAFSMSNVGLTLTGPLPGTSKFLECNVRTYVRQKDSTNPGVWFYSLDAANAIMAATARATYSLPYYFANMTTVQVRKQMGGTWHKTVSYETHRLNPKFRPADCSLEYELSPGTVRRALAGTIEEFLIERYRLYAYRNKQLHWAHVHHQPYLLEPANLIKLEQTLTEAGGITVPDQEPMVHFSREVLVEIEPLTRLDSSSQKRRSSLRTGRALPQPA